LFKNIVLNVKSPWTESALTSGSMKTAVACKHSKSKKKKKKRSIFKSRKYNIILIYLLNINLMPYF
jgi:hypothetical protein